MTGFLGAMIIGFELLAVLLLTAVSPWLGRARLRATIGALAGALCLTVGLLFAAITIGVRGYRALTQEVVAATIVTEPLAPQRFRATVTLPDGRLHMYDLA